MPLLLKSFVSGALMVLLLLTSCTRGDAPSVPTASTPSSTQTSPSPATAPTTRTEQIEFKQEGGDEIFTLKLRPDGAKLVDASEVEIARLTVDANQKIKIKDANDQTLGYIVSRDGYWKVENADQTQELYILRRQDDGDYKLEDGADQQIYRIKVRDYGYEIETPTKESLYKVKLRDGKISLRNAQDETVLYTRAAIAPIAVACFGFDVLSPEQQAALAFAVSQTGGQ